MKLTDIKNLPETINKNAVMRQAGFSEEALRKRVTRNSPELTPEEQAKLDGVIKSTINELSKIVYTNTAINKLKKRSKG